jgi:hypothetical protein
MKEPGLRVMLPFYTSVVNFKFVHVTRDVRHIHNTHDSENMHKYIVDPSHAADFDSALRAGRKLNLDARSLEFAQVWAWMELSLHLAWKRDRSSYYFHLSETSMATNMTRVLELAAFLGAPSLDLETALSIQRIYKRVNASHDAHWDTMQQIVALPGNELVRRALHTFGYTV